jgi:hypothetical protein
VLLISSSTITIISTLVLYKDSKADFTVERFLEMYLYFDFGFSHVKGSLRIRVRFMNSTIFVNAINLLTHRYLLEQLPDKKAGGL